MDCNKDEAVRAKEIAEQKLAQKDVSGAVRFASKARSLFSGLEGLSQFQEILDIYTAAERKVNGEVDWYSVLSVDPLSDEETIRKKYRKLALALHPDKNKAVGADGAFKILSEAWSLLSDKVKRAVYDQKRDLRASRNNVTGLNPAVGIQKNGRYNFTNASSAAKNSSAPANSQTDSTPSRSNGNSFWTSCKRCRMHYEYLGIYRNQNLLCPNCRLPFLATEMPPPPAKSNVPWKKYRKYQKQPSGYPAGHTSPDLGRKFTPTQKTETPGFSRVDSMSRENIPQSSSFKFGGSRSMPTPAKDAAQRMHRFQSTGDYLKRGHEEAFSGTIKVGDVGKKSNASSNTDGLPTYNVSIFSKGEQLSKKTRVDEYNATQGRKDFSTQMTQSRKGFFSNQMPQSGAGGRSNKDSRNHMDRSVTEKILAPGTYKSKSLVEMSHSENRNLLTEKARMEIRKKLQEWSAANNTFSKGRVDKEMEKDIPTVSARDKSVLAGTMKARNYNTSIKGEQISIQPKRSSLSSIATGSDSKPTKVASARVPSSDGLKESSLSPSAIDSDTKATEIMTMSVPDPEFYDFDKDRTEEVFAGNQVWAAYDGEDGMPRYYAIIHDVISRNPFKVRISWLNSKSNSELGPLDWVGCGFTKTCGDFRMGKHVISRTLNSFSHRVKWSKGSRGVIHIFPKKGDVWALYRNWSSDWNELTPDDVIRQYDIVEVIQDYNEEQGVVAVAPLVKVAGFRSVFHQHLDSSKVYTIPREDMFRFSHQVASFNLTGQEATTAPKGCRELDTAAMPLEQLQIIKELIQAKGGITATQLSGMRDPDAMNISRDAKDVVKEELIMYSRKTKGKGVAGETSGEKGVSMLAGEDYSPI